ncbi:YdaS family helix-turn-helix protein [Pseudomonas sp. G11]|uniref:transcriptional regulator n=1 Tax=Pseudomonas sp. G11 TaxID=528343 RepID=UPI002402CEEB|nr:YdaS family helix-turn-helix protein [Pseudomonas sp. G11]WEX16254.1 YdaS family helix-turn-helix protein [Pseudomonas sp. G11]
MSGANPIERAVAVAGSQSSLSRILCCTPQNVQRMCSTGHVPAKHVLKIEAATGVSRHDLRPDIYPDHPPTLNTNVRPNPSGRQSTDGAGVLSSTAEVA